MFRGAAVRCPSCRRARRAMGTATTGSSATGAAKPAFAARKHLCGRGRTRRDPRTRRTATGPMAPTRAAPMPQPCSSLSSVVAGWRPNGGQAWAAFWQAGASTVLKLEQRCGRPMPRPWSSLSTAMALGSGTPGRPGAPPRTRNRARRPFAPGCQGRRRRPAARRRRRRVSAPRPFRCGSRRSSGTFPRANGRAWLREACCGE